MDRPNSHSYSTMSSANHNGCHLLGNFDMLKNKHQNHVKFCLNILSPVFKSKNVLGMCQSWPRHSTSHIKIMLTLAILFPASLHQNAYGRAINVQCIQKLCKYFPKTNVEFSFSGCVSNQILRFTCIPPVREVSNRIV